MNTQQRMEQALGPPVLFRKLQVAGDAALTVGRWRHGDAHATTKAGDDVATIIYNLSNTQHVERLRHGTRTAGPFEVGTVSVVGPDEETSFRIQGDADVFQIFLPMELINLAGGRDEGPSVAPMFQEHDRAIERCAIRAMVAARSGGHQDDLRLSEVATELAMQLVSGHQRSTTVRIGGLAPHRLRRVQELVAHRLSEPEARPPTLEELAREADLSLFHFARAFRQTVGETPHAYVLQRRVALSRSILATSSYPIAEVARIAGFRSQSHFSERFRQAVGVRPSQFRSALRDDD